MRVKFFYNNLGIDVVIIYFALSLSICIMVIEMFIFIIMFVWSFWGGFFMRNFKNF